MHTFFALFLAAPKQAEKTRALANAQQKTHTTRTHQSLRDSMQHNCVRAMSAPSEFDDEKIGMCQCDNYTCFVHAHTHACMPTHTHAQCSNFRMRSHSRNFAPANKTHCTASSADAARSVSSLISGMCTGPHGHA